MRRSIFFKATALLLVAGCDVLGLYQSCTLIGCANGLTVQLQGSVPTEFTIRATAGSVVREQQCNEARCRESVFFEEFRPDTVTIEIIAATGSNSRQFTPSYKGVYPNGPDCGETCRQATVTFSL
jgi:hypothetical protein